MDKILRDEIGYWLDRYIDEEDQYNTGLEQEMRDKFQLYNEMTLDDLKQIVEWKFQSLPGRKKRTFNLLANAKDDHIRMVSRAAFASKNDNERLSLFCSIKGVGPAITSVILAFHDPDGYGVFDIHAYREIFGKNQSEDPRDLFTSRKYVLRFFQELRKMSEGVGMRCRDVEKALFKKNLEETR